MSTIVPPTTDVQDETEPGPGDWVTVLGQVSDERTHPDDIAVEFFSHNAQFDVNVRRDRVALAPVPAFAEQCACLVEMTDGSLLRCTRHHEHGGVHSCGAVEWAEGKVYGYVEVC